MVEDLPPVVLHGRELGHVESTEPPVGVGLPICNLIDPRPLPPLLDPEVGPRRLSGPREDMEVLEPAYGRGDGRIEGPVTADRQRAHGGRRGHLGGHLASVG